MYVSAGNFAFSNIKRAYHSHFGEVNRPQSPHFRRIQKKTLSFSVFLIKMADRKGFEPLVPFRGTHDFQSCAFDQLSHLSMALSAVDRDSKMYYTSFSAGVKSFFLFFSVFFFKGGDRRAKV